MKKVFGQTVRDFKREVNKKVLKVPGIEQKILDATSNEAWGPHGSQLADLAQASRNFHECQMIMNVIWKRINDTGKNWRHVHKALTVLEYLVAHGSERVIDEIREHAYQITTLSNFQYIDSNGRDQGNTVRRNSQSLVALVNDKERIQEVRQKASANRDKYQSTISTGGTRDRYDDDHPEGRYGNRDDDRNGHERERDNGYRSDDKYGRSRESNSRDGDRYGRDNEEHIGRDGYRSDDYGGRGTDDYQLGSRRSVDRYTDHSVDDDDLNSSRSSGGRGDNHSHNVRRLGQHLSEENVGAPPGYEEATRDAQKHTLNERDEEAVASPTDRSSSSAAPKATSPMKSTSQGPDHVVSSESPAAPSKEVNAFDEFDPRGSLPVALPSASDPELDIFGYLSTSDSTNSLALIPLTSTTATTSESVVPINSGFGMYFAAPSETFSEFCQTNENPFGEDSPFKATPQENFQAQPHNFIPVHAPFPPVAAKVETVPGFDFGDMLGGLSYDSHAANGQHSSATASFPKMHVAPASDDVLDGILPRTDSAAVISSQTVQHAAPTDSQTAQVNRLPEPEVSAMFPPQAGPNNMESAHLNFLHQQGVSVSATLPSQISAISSQAAQPANPNNMQSPHLNFLQHSVSVSASLPSQEALPNSMQSAQMNFLQQSGSSSFLQLAHPAAPNNMQLDHLNIFQQQSVSASTPLPSLAAPFSSAVPGNIQAAQLNPLQQAGVSTPPAPQAAPTTSFGPPAKTKPRKFEPKSTVWADTLNRGLVDLNISGPKTNPLADIGVDFDSINRMEKRKEGRSSAAPVTSTITMGKAMGAGSGIGRAGATGLAPAPNPMMRASVGIGMGTVAGAHMGMGAGMGTVGGTHMGMGAGMGMGGYGGGMNQPSMGMNMGMGQVAPMRPPNGMPPPGPGIPDIGYNPMMGMGNYGSQQPYGGVLPQQPYGGGHR